MKRLMKRKLLISFFFFFFFFFFSILALFSTTTTTTNSRASEEFRDPFTTNNKPQFYLQKFDKAQKETRIVFNKGAITYRKRKLLGGPGSWPPRCTSKCGTCTPCRPVHVAVPPGTPVTAEYYPEAWRCKCGNKLYMP